MAARSGRTRSSGGVPWPMWTKPATLLVRLQRRSGRGRRGHRPRHSVSHAVTKPIAFAATTRFMHTAPAESTCSHSGIFTCGAAGADHGDHQRRAAEATALHREPVRVGRRGWRPRKHLRRRRRAGRAPRPRRPREAPRRRACRGRARARRGEEVVAARPRAWARARSSSAAATERRVRRRASVSVISGSWSRVWRKGGERRGSARSEAIHAAFRPAMFEVASRRTRSS